MNLIFCVLMLVALPLLSYGQEMVKYSADFTFDDGIYLSFEDFKNNNPIPVTHIVSHLDIRESDYLEQVLVYDSVVYYDNLYEERRASVEDLWGFCSRNRVFIGFGVSGSINNPEFFDFYPLLNIGAVSFFTAVESYYRTFSTGPNVGVGGYDPMLDNQVTVTESEQVQLLLEFRTGKIILVGRGELASVPVDLVRQILQSDKPLLAEYDALSNRDKKQKGMFYLRRFNDRNPVYFPDL